ncbi:MAG: alkaline phosphatase [Firmicutes bacterium]|nr:alkaline phosphatase [Bacillota bacterium]
MNKLRFKLLTLAVVLALSVGMFAACASQPVFPDNFTVTVDGISPGGTATTGNQTNANEGNSSQSSSQNTNTYNNNYYTYYGEAGELAPIKNVIMMVPDGMSVSATSLARYMLPNNEDGMKNLYMDEYVSGLMRTTWAAGPVTDSAPAATAFSTGHKGWVGALGVDGDANPKATILEGAKAVGKATGMIATSEFMHATPAGYTAHEFRRGNYEIVARQIISNELNVYFGSGSAKITTTDFVGYIQDAGYDVVESRTEMNAVSAPAVSSDVSDTLKVWGDFNSNAGKNNLSYDIDRVDEEPSLAEMTQKAIELLSADTDGFFLMVEGSKIDWAAHDNDTIGILSDVLAFDKAFRAAVEFAKADGQTLVFSVSDHGNSGISIGNYDLVAGTAGYGYDASPWDFLKPLKNASLTAEGALMLKAGGATDDQVLMAYGIDSAKYSATSALVNHQKVHAKIQAFKAISGTGLDKKLALVEVMNQLCYIGYTTYGHTGEDLNFYMYAPKGYTVGSLIGKNGFIDNTDVAKLIAAAMKIDLERLTDDLFVPVYSDGESLLPFGYTVTLVSATTSAAANAGYVYEAVFSITKGSKTLTVTSAGNTYKIGAAAPVKYTNGVNVYNIVAANTYANRTAGTLYVPAEALATLY